MDMPEIKTPKELINAAKEKLPDVAEQAKDVTEKAKDVAEKAKSKLPDVAEQAKEAAEKVKEATTNAAENVKEAASNAADNAKEAASTAAENAKEAASAAAEKMAERFPNPDLDENGNPIVYSHLDDLPSGEAVDTIKPGCLVLEGGAFRGLYTQGVLDALMQEGINFQTTIGISAGALSGIGYVAGQIGWAARINLTYRHNTNYIGTDAMKRDHGITGFSFLFNDALQEHPINEARFNDPRRRFVVGTTDLNTGEEEYFEKGKCADILKAAQASATVPYISRPVVIDGVPYLDGGLVVNIPYHWAKLEKFRKIIVVKTRDRSYRAEIGEHKQVNQLFYGSYPNLLDKLNYNDVRYNCLLDEIDVDEQAGHIFVIAPSKPVEISRFEGDMEKLGDLYWEGYHDMQQEMPRLKEYLEQ